jgi:hypothetical protein
MQWSHSSVRKFVLATLKNKKQCSEHIPRQENLCWSHSTRNTAVITFANNNICAGHIREQRTMQWPHSSTRKFVLATFKSNKQCSDHIPRLRKFVLATLKNKKQCSDHIPRQKNLCWVHSTARNNAVTTFVSKIILCGQTLEQESLPWQSIYVNNENCCSHILRQTVITKLENRTHCDNIQHVVTTVLGSVKALTGQRRNLLQDVCNGSIWTCLQGHDESVSRERERAPPPPTITAGVWLRAK